MVRSAWILIAALGCSSAPKQDTTTTTSDSPPPTTAAAPADGAGSTTVTTTTTTSTTTPAATPGKPAQPAAAPAKPGQSAAAPAAKPLYSCFSYVAAGTNTKRHNCMKTDDCGTYLDQAKGIKGIRDLTGCASVASVWCFHQVVKGDPEGVDVCQPTEPDCKTMRATAVKAKESVDTDCALR